MVLSTRRSTLWISRSLVLVPLRYLAFSQNTQILSNTLLCVVTGCHIADLRLLVSPFCSTWITDWDSFFRSLFKVKILRNFLWYEIRSISPSFKVFAILRIPSSLRITAAFRSVFHDSRSFRETTSPVSSFTVDYTFVYSLTFVFFGAFLRTSCCSLGVHERWSVDSRCNIWQAIIIQDSLTQRFNYKLLSSSSRTSRMTISLHKLLFQLSPNLRQNACLFNKR